MAKEKETKKVTPSQEEEVMMNPKKARKEALLKLAAYLKKHHLDPEKDWDKDPIHGKKVSKYYQIIRVAEEKVRHKQAKLIKPEVHPKKKVVTKAPSSYNYPDINGQPMSAVMKKKYRSKMRALLKSNMDLKKAEATALQFAQKWDNSDDPTKRVLRKKSLKTGEEATIPLKKNQVKPKSKKKVTKKTSKREED